MDLLRERLGWFLAGAALVSFLAGAVEYCAPDHDTEPLTNSRDAR